PELRDLHGDVRVPVDRDKSMVMLAIRSNGQRNELGVRESCVGAEACWQRVAGYAAEDVRVEKPRRAVKRKPALGITLAERLPGRRESPCRKVSRERQGCSKRVVEVPEGIGWKVDRRQEVLELLHLVGRQCRVCAQQS